MTYVKPIVNFDSSVAEGVYAASGCYTASSYITQTPELGRGTYVIQVNAHHDATHTNSSQTLTIVFNQRVEYVSCGGQGARLKSDGSNTLVIELSYNQNRNDNIGLGDLTVTSDSGLQIISTTVTDNV